MNKHTILIGAAVGTLNACIGGADGRVDTVTQAIAQSGITFEIAASLPDGGVALDDEHCRLPAALRDQIGVGRQARLVFDNGARLALCTVDAVAAAAGDGGVARAEVNAATLQGRFGVAAGTTQVTGVEVNNEVADGGVGQIAVQQTGASPVFNFTPPSVQEWRSATLPASADRVIYTAPHALIETGVNGQVTRALNNASPWSAGWLAMYRQTTQSAGFSHFHITSTDLHTQSFPGLGAMISAGFRYAVAFHGCTSCGDVIVGGGEDVTFRTGLAELLRDGLTAVMPAAPTITVPVSGALAGTHPDNFVNRLANGHGLQFEQGSTVRGNTTYSDVVATTVRTYLDCLVEAPDADDNTLNAAGQTVTRDVATYEAGFCPRAMVTYASTVALTSLTGAGTSCLAGARVRVDLFRRRADQSYQRIGGGYRVGQVVNGTCAYSDLAGYITPSAAALAAGEFRVVVRAADANGALVSARAIAGS
ncbi:MAG: poly-gamma-glutamate hydrolase family protein [Polyangiales bacterium]